MSFTYATDLSESWVDFLRQFPWQWFGNFTFRSAIHPEAADKAYRHWVNRLNRQLYGPRWYRKGQFVFWARGLEWQKRDVLHYHALLCTVDGTDLNQVARRLDWMDAWQGMGCPDPSGNSPGSGPGYARIYPADHGRGVCAYISKYVVKGGEIDICPYLLGKVPDQLKLLRR